MADVTLPQLGETVTEGTITRWFKKVGDTVAADEGGFPWREVQFVLMPKGDAVPDRRAIAKQSVRAEERYGAEHHALVGLR